MKTASLFVAIAIIALSSGLALAGDSPADCAAALKAKGATVKTEKDGTPIELYLPPTIEMTLADWQTVGKITTLHQFYSNAKGLPLNDESAAALSNLNSVEKFFANGAELSDDGFKAFSGFKSLKNFGLDHWGWKTAGKGTLGPGLAHLAPVSTLQSVRLGGCKADNRVCTALADVKSLQSVDLGHCYAVTDEGITALATLPNLHIIKLSPQYSPRITDGTLAALGAAKSLEEIQIGETWLTYERGFSHIKGLASLKKITLQKVVASDEDIAKLKSDHPSAEVVWTKPDEAVATKCKTDFQKFWDKQSGKK